MTEQWTGIVSTVGKALVAKVPGQLVPHRYAHDKAMRIVRTLDKLVAALPATERPPRLDLVRIAALYACTGVDSAASNSPGKRLHSHGPLPQASIDDAAELATDQLQSILPPADIDLTVRILHEHRTKAPNLPEAKLLADAVSLEEMGLVGLWNQTRNCHLAGKSLDHLLKLWRTQKEYGYWEARLRDGFHFAVAREAAALRLKRMEPIFEAMQHEHLADDILPPP